MQNSPNSQRSCPKTKSDAKGGDIHKTALAKQAKGWGGGTAWWVEGRVIACGVGGGRKPCLSSMSGLAKPRKLFFHGFYCLPHYHA